MPVEEGLIRASPLWESLGICTCGTLWCLQTRSCLCIRAPPSIPLFWTGGLWTMKWKDMLSSSPWCGAEVLNQQEHLKMKPTSKSSAQGNWILNPRPEALSSLSFLPICIILKKLCHLHLFSAYCNPKHFLLYLLIRKLMFCYPEKSGCKLWGGKSVNK